MFENWQKLVSTLKSFVLFLRIPKLHNVKQNEKYPYAYFCVVWVTFTVVLFGMLDEQFTRGTGMYVEDETETADE